MCSALEVARASSASDLYRFRYSYIHGTFSQILSHIISLLLLYRLFFTAESLLFGHVLILIIYSYYNIYARSNRPRAPRYIVPNYIMSCTSFIIRTIFCGKINPAESPDKISVTAQCCSIFFFFFQQRLWRKETTMDLLRKESHRRG